MPVEVTLGDTEFVMDQAHLNVRRQSGPDGRLSAAYPDFRQITLQRSLQNSVAQDDGTDGLLETISAIGQDAVAGGEITAYQANQPQTPYMQIRFDEAHIEDFDIDLRDVGGQGALESVLRIVLSVSSFSANNAKFTRAGQAAA